MTMARPSHEYEIQAALEYAFTRLGGARPSYGSIVGGGVHGTQLHYMRDRGDVKPGDVVVMDAATEYEGYAADVTRTIPVSGKYSPEQRALYELIDHAEADLFIQKRLDSDFITCVQYDCGRLSCAQGIIGQLQTRETCHIRCLKMQAGHLQQIQRCDT